MTAEPSNRLHLVVPKRLFLSTRFQIRPASARWLLLRIKVGPDLVRETALQRKEPTKERATNCFRCTFTSWQGPAPSRLPFSTSSLFPTTDARCTMHDARYPGIIDEVTPLPSHNKNAFRASCPKNEPCYESVLVLNQSFQQNSLVEKIMSLARPSQDVLENLTTIHSSIACQGDQKSFPRKVGISIHL